MRDRPGLLTTVARWWIGRAEARQATRRERQLERERDAAEKARNDAQAHLEIVEAQHRSELHELHRLHEEHRREAESRLRASQADTAAARHERDLLAEVTARLSAINQAASLAIKADNPDATEKAIAAAQRLYAQTPED